MALLNKRSRNIEGLLASRLGDQDAPRKLQERGVHGALTSDNKVRYGTKGQEGRNCLKAVDKYYNKDNWGSGASPFMQGSSSYDETFKYNDPIQKIGKKEKMLSDRMAELDDKSLGDEQGMGSAGLFKSEDVPPPMVGEDHLKMMGPQYEKTGLGAAYLDEDENMLDQMAMDSEALDEWHQDQASEKKEDEAHAMEAMADAYPQFEGDERAAKQKAFEEAVASDDDLGFAEPEGPGMWDKVKGLFSSDDEGGGKKKKKMSKEAMKYGADLMKGMMQEPSQGQRQMPTSKVTRGSVPFAGLLAQKTPRQRNPYFTPKGLV